MKKLHLALVGLSCLVLAGCDRGPGATAVGFMNCIAQADAEGARKLSTGNAQGMMLDIVIPEAKREKERGVRHDFAVVKEVIKGETAEVRLKDTQTEKDGTKRENKEEQLKLIKSDGQWKVNVTK